MELERAEIPMFLSSNTACDRIEEGRGKGRIAVQLTGDERRQMFANIGREMFGIFAVRL